MAFWGSLAVLFVLVALAQTARFGWWQGEVALSILPQIGLLALIVALMIAVMGRPVTSLVSLALACLAFFQAREQFAPASQPVAARGARIVWANVFDHEDSLARALRFAAREDADAVIIAELPERLPAERRRALLGPFVHEAGEAVDQTTNVTIFSRWPLADVRIAAIGKRPGVAATMQKPGGALVVAGVHPSVPFNARMYAQRDASIRAAIALLDGRTGVLVGDFNTVPWSATLRTIAAEGRVRRASLGALSATWMAPWPLLGLPIDHAFAAGASQVSARVGPGTGSDHFPLIVDVAQGGG